MVSAISGAHSNRHISSMKVHTRMKKDNDLLVLASKFLRKPIARSFEYYLAKVLGALPLTSRGQSKIARANDRSDFKALASRLRRLSRMFPPGHIKHLEQHAHSFSIPSDGFRRQQVVKRREALFSDWHGKLFSARNSEVEDWPNVTISIVTYNSAKWLPVFFASLLTQKYPLSKISFFIVDHGSSDNTLNLLSDFISRNSSHFYQLDLCSRENMGFGAGHDFNIRRSVDEYVLVSNVDIEFLADSITAIVAAASSDDLNIGSWELRQCPYEHPKFYDPITLETAWSSHACVLLRRNAYIKVGGYEPHIFMYGEDVELSYRLRRDGFRLRYVPFAAVRHFVDFHDANARPLQASGSISANVLLRYRYGGESVGDQALASLEEKLALERSSERRKAFRTAIDVINQDKFFFVENSRITASELFPFHDFNYEITREGHDVSVDSGVSLENEPLVTIITRTHGANQDILREAIACVLNQTYKNIEHIIVEDSGDLSKELVEKVARVYGVNIRHVVSTGSGRSRAGNDGLAHSGGAYVMFFDNDDLLFSDHVECLVRNIITSEGKVAVYSLAWMVATHYGSGGFYRESNFSLIEDQNAAFDAQLLKKRNFIPIQSILFKSNLYRRYGGFDESIDHLEDWNLWVRYSQMGAFLQVPKTTSIFRVPGDPFLYTERHNVMTAARKAVIQKNEIASAEKNG